MANITVENGQSIQAVIDVSHDGDVIFVKKCKKEEIFTWCLMKTEE